MSVTFKRIQIPKEYGKTIFDIYYSKDNNRSQVMDNFNNLPKVVKDDIKDLISKMATVKDFKSPKIKYNLHGFNYGEIRPKPHRFFFFQKCGNNYIFFEYVLPEFCMNIVYNDYRPL